MIEDLWLSRVRRFDFKPKIRRAFKPIRLIEGEQHPGPENTVL
jgi:hypothetical protein